MSDDKQRGKWVFVLRIGLSLLLLGILFWRFDWTTLRQALQRVRWAYLVGPVLCFWAGFWLSGLRWQAILRGMDLPLPLRDLLLLNLKGFFWNNFLPSTIGGDGYRFLQLGRRYPSQRASVFTSIFLDRLYGYVTLLGVHGALLPLLAWWLRGQRILAGIEGGILLGMVTLLFVWLGRRTWRGHLTRWMEKAPRLRDKVMRVLAMTAQSSQAVAVRGALYSAGFVLLNGVALWFYLRALEVRLPVLPVWYASTLAGILGALPLSVNGLGLTELALVLALSPLGARREEILLAAFLLRGVNLAMALPGGVLYLWESWRGR